MQLSRPVRLVLASVALIFCMLFSSLANAETRKLKLYFLHTGERAEITYKRNGKFVKSGLTKINKFLRDWRRNEPTKMDPRLLDLIWEVYQETGSRKHIHVVSAYRSPATNKLLRKRGSGVAKKSQHTLGKAMDFFIPGVNLRKLRDIGLKKGLGGVGYYPKSGSPFVHMDTGRVRHWPRMNRKELVRVFPRGKTLHVPSDGKPLAKYNQAKAEYERKVKGGNNIVVADAEEIIKKPSLFAKLLGRGEDDESGVGAVSVPRAVATTRQTGREENATPKPEPTPKPQPEPAPAVAEPTAPSQLPDRSPLTATPEILLASLPAELVPIPLSAPRTAPEAPNDSVINEIDELVGSDAEVDLPPANDIGLQPTEDAPLPSQIEERLQPENGLPKPTIAIASASSDLSVPRPQVDVGQNDQGVEIDQVETALEAEPAPQPENQPVELAYGYPVPQLRPTAEDSLSIASQEPVDTNPLNETTKLAALSPSEIESLRREVYAVLTGDKENPVEPLTLESRVEVATVEPADVDAEPSNQLSLIPQPSPQREAQRVIEQQIAQLEPIEPGVKATDGLAIPSNSPRTQPDTQSVIAFAPIEPGVKETGELALPLPNPAAKEDPVDDQIELASISDNIPVPKAANRPLLIASNSPLTAEEAGEIRKLETLSSIELDERLVGKWALAADTSISDIAEIRPPAYARNIIRELPSTVLSRGFVQGSRSPAAHQFTGSSIEFLDFTRLN